MKKNLNKLHPNTCRTLPGAAEHGTAVYAVIGDPIEHSRSPEIYAPMFEQFGINAVFLKIRVTESELCRIRSIVSERSLSGFAVTMPHKKAIIPLLDGIDETAAECGSVNIVTISNNGSTLVGHNTDGDGLINALSGNRSRAERCASCHSRTRRRGKRRSLCASSCRSRNQIRYP